MDKAYVIKVLDKNDAKLDYKNVINLTRKVLLEANKNIDNVKITLRFNWFKLSQDVVENIYESCVEGAKIASKQFSHLLPNNIKPNEMLSYKALYKGLMNILIKLQDGMASGTKNSLPTDYVSLLMTLVTEVVKVGFIRTAFYLKHANDEKIVEYIIHVIGGVCLGFSHWFGYAISDHASAHEMIRKFYIFYIKKGQGDETVSSFDVLTLIDQMTNFLEYSAYLINEMPTEK